MVNEKNLDFIGKQLQKLVYSYEKHIFKILDNYDDHKNRGRLLNEIILEINDAEKALDILLTHYLKNVYLYSYEQTRKELTAKKLLSKTAGNVEYSNLGGVSPYALAYMQEYFSKYKTPFMLKWNEEEKQKIFKVIEESALSGYSRTDVANNLKKLFDSRDSYYWQMVARTEGTRVFTGASINSANDLGFNKKRVIVSGPGCEDCYAAAEEGWIGINEDNLAGEGKIPFHPHCMCHYEYDYDGPEHWAEADSRSDEEIAQMEKELEELFNSQIKEIDYKMNKVEAELEDKYPLSKDHFTDAELKHINDFKETNNKYPDIKFNTDISQALEEYKGIIYKHLNRWLRAGQPDTFNDEFGAPLSKRFIDELRKMVPLLDKALEQSGVDKDRILFRGVDWEVEKKFNLWQGTILDGGYESWSLDLYQAEKFLKVGAGGKYLLLKTVIKKGQKAIYLESAKNGLKLFDQNGSNLITDDELEFFLERDLKIVTIEEKEYKYEDLFPKSKYNTRDPTRSSRIGQTVKIRTVVFSDEE